MGGLTQKVFRSLALRAPCIENRTMISLKQARESGNLDQFITEHKGESGDLDAFERAIRSMVENSTEAPATSPPDGSDD